MTTSSPTGEQYDLALEHDGHRVTGVVTQVAAGIRALAVDGIARACVDDPEELLVRLLRDAIDVVATFAPLTPTPVTVTWAEQAPAASEVRADASRRPLVR